MSTTHDELAGVVDLFGALTNTQLADALGELAFKKGQDVDEDALHVEIKSAIDAYALVEYKPADALGEPADESADEPGSETPTDDPETLITVGPTAFPTLPANAEDLPHILDYERRTVDRDRLADQVSQRLTAEATAAVASEDTDRAAELLDVAYDVEMWASVETEEVRSKLAAVLPQD